MNIVADELCEYPELSHNLFLKKWFWWILASNDYALTVIHFFTLCMQQRDGLWMPTAYAQRTGEKLYTRLKPNTKAHVRYNFSFRAVMEKLPSVWVIVGKWSAHFYSHDLLCMHRIPGICGRVATADIECLSQFNSYIGSTINGLKDSRETLCRWKTGAINLLIPCVADRICCGEMGFSSAKVTLENTFPHFLDSITNSRQRKIFIFHTSVNSTKQIFLEFKFQLQSVKFVPM